MTATGTPAPEQQLHATDHLLTRRRPLVPLSPEFVRFLHRLTFVWALFAVVGLELARRALWLDHRPGTEAFEIEARPYFLALFTLGALLAWRWEILGGAIAAFTAAGVVVWQGHQLEQPDATLVVLVFAVPGAAWVLLDLHDRRPRVALAGLVFVSVSAVAGSSVATDVYDGLFGPTQPDSVATLPEGTRVDWIWTGAVTTSGAVITARLHDDVERPELVVTGGTDPAPVAVVTATPDEQGVARFAVSGLEPDIEYRVNVRDGDEAAAGPSVTEATFRTFPEGASSFTLVVASCARVGTNAAVFDTIRELDPTLVVIDGDLHYSDIGRDDPQAFREVLDLVLGNPGPSALLRSTPLAYVWDDHDYGPNNADRTSPARSAAQSVYREYVPHYPLVDDGTGAVSQAFDLGRARVIITDGRSNRDPASDPDDAAKSMLGESQQRWLERELLAARNTHELVIWVNPSPWVGEAVAGADGWAGYSTERAEIADFIAEHHIDNLLMLSGDAHMVAIDDGTNTQYATGEHADDPGFPLLHGAALDRPGHTKGGPYSEGMAPGSGQFGLVTVDDLGDRLEVRLQGLDWQGAELLTYEFTVDG